MAANKEKTVFLCTECGADFPKWSGKCPSCGMWNTMVEKTVRTSGAPAFRKAAAADGTQQPATMKLADVRAGSEQRISMNDGELDRVLGGGLGIGKSTLVLQTVMRLKGLRTLYVSGEESASQIKMRANRIEADSTDASSHDNLLVLCETSLESIYSQIKEQQPQLVVIDSIQTICSEYADSGAGSITQVRECATSLLKYAKESGVPVLLIGHITKEGSIAGPKILEHIVDAVLQFEGDQHYLYRILRPIKNRFGSTAELGIYEMRQNGLRQVNNPSELLLTDSHKGLSGVSIACTVEGVRPFLIEVQALASTAVYGTPQRNAIGFEVRRMNMLLAVLEKRAGFKLGQKDVFLNIAGGLRVNDPAIDLAVISSVLSSSIDIAVDPTVCMTGEVGLSGEIRPVSRIEQRIAESEKLGFKRILIPRNNMHGLDTKKYKIEIVPVSKVEEAFKQLFS